MALDLSKLPSSPSQTTTTANTNDGTSFTGTGGEICIKQPTMQVPVSEWPGLIATYKHRDNKLRGFSTAKLIESSDYASSISHRSSVAAAAEEEAGVVVSGSKSQTSSEYRIICGLGIKNLHVWQFTTRVETLPAEIVVNASGDSDEAQEKFLLSVCSGSSHVSSDTTDDSPTTTHHSVLVPPAATTQRVTVGEWTHIYDIVTNGISVLCAGFRCGGYQVMSKSDGASVRVSNSCRCNSDIASIQV